MSNSGSTVDYIHLWPEGTFQIIDCIVDRYLRSTQDENFYDNAAGPTTEGLEMKRDISDMYAMPDKTKSLKKVATSSK